MLVLVLATAGPVLAQNKVVVIPLGSEPTGNAAVGDVLKGKTFSNASGTGLTGKRPTSPVPKTGQMGCYYDNGTTGTCTCGTANCLPGQDGDLVKGETWPNPRFHEIEFNGSPTGQIYDGLTGLTWLKKGNCSSFYQNDITGTNNRSWGKAIVACNSLAVGYCGLSSYYATGDWRLPNRNELNSLISLGSWDNATPGGYLMTGTQGMYYWTATSYRAISSNAWAVDFLYGSVNDYPKSEAHYVRCVH